MSDTAIFWIGCFTAFLCILFALTTVREFMKM